MNEMKCPVVGHTAGSGLSNREWWPNQLNLKILHQFAPPTNPMSALL